MSRNRLIVLLVVAMVLAAAGGPLAARVAGLIGLSAWCVAFYAVGAFLATLIARAPRSTRR